MGDPQNKNNGFQNHPVIPRAALVFAAVALGVWLRGIPNEIDIDSYAYQKMAGGKMGEVVQPYANRVLHPLLVQSIAKLGIQDNALIFAGVGAVSLFIFVFSVAGLVGKRLPPLGLAAMLCSPVLCLYCVNIYLPDLFYLAQWGLLLLLMRREKILWGAILLFFMQMTRESTVLVAAAIIAAAVFHKKWKWAFAAGAALLCGMAAVSWLARGAQTNIHGLNGIFYMGTKVLANAAANLLGITVWTDSYARVLPHMYPEMPVWKTGLPAWLSLGGVGEVGIYEVNPAAFFRTTAVVLSTFGVLPVLLLRHVKNTGWKKLKDLPFFPLVLLLSGVAFYGLGMVSGRSVDRLTGYGWPVFWVFLPLFYGWKKGAQNETMDPPSIPCNTLFWVLQILCQWAPLLVFRIHAPFQLAAGLAAVLLCHWCAWKLLARLTAQNA